MTPEKIAYEEFLHAVDDNYKVFTEKLHNFLLETGCKVTFEEKKTSLLGSYKYNKKATVNLFIKKQGLLVRIYGENLDGYRDFLNTLPEEMVNSIEKAAICGRLVNNTCSPKCSGYDFIIRNEHFQKCRYNCFEFKVTDESIPYIKTFVESEVKARTIL